MGQRSSSEALDRPVLFLGPTRSGKSMLAHVLGTVPGFSLAFEPETIWNIGQSRRDDDRRAADEATPAIVGRIRGELQRYLVNVGATRYVDDLPHHALRAAFCHRVLPEARFVVVFRDGRESIREMLYGWRHRDSLGKVWKRRMSESTRQSLRLSRLPKQGMRWLYNRTRQRLVGRKRTWGPTVPGQLEYARTHSLVETVAYQWTQLAQHVLDGVAELPEDRVLRMRYEDVREAPHAEAVRLATFCEADPLQVTAAADRVIELDRPAYADPLTPEEYDLILPIFGDLQERLGYSVEAPPGAGEMDRLRQS